LIRYQRLLKEVNAAHQEEYGKSLEDRVESETGGDYRKILKKILSTGLEL